MGDVADPPDVNVREVHLAHEGPDAVAAVVSLVQPVGTGPNAASPI